MLMIAAGLILLLAIIILLTGVVVSQRGQKAIYYAARREAQRNATRLYSWSLWCAGLAVALFIAGRFLPTEVLPTSEPQPEMPPTRVSLETPTPNAGDLSANPNAATAVSTIPTPAPAAPAAPAADGPTIEPTPTFTAIPFEATPTLAPQVIEITPLAAATETPVAVAATASVSSAVGAVPTNGAVAVQPTVQPVVITVIASGKPLTLRAVSSEIDGGNAPIKPSTQFVSGTQTIYVVFDFQDIPRGTVLRHTWLRNGVSVSFSSAPFTKTGLGTDSISWTPKGGFDPGLYEVRVALANTLQFTANFLVK